MDIDLQEGWGHLERWIRTERLGRRRYVEAVVLTLVVGFATILTPFLFILLLPDFNSDFLMVPVASVGIAAAIIMLLVYIAASIARLRDMGRSTNWFVAGLIPYLNVIFFMVLALTEGKRSKERSGRKPAREAKESEPVLAEAVPEAT
ncbi:MAG TPA: DUF805 domain-containing protein [Candidatus Paceibacterota bacterium]|jgi:uncharacterized membrane protein YhaH (DUF805 family)